MIEYRVITSRSVELVMCVVDGAVVIVPPPAAAEPPVQADQSEGVAFGVGSAESPDSS